MSSFLIILIGCQALWILLCYLLNIFYIHVCFCLFVFLIFILRCNWLLESSLIPLVLTVMIVCWVWNNVHFWVNYTQWLRQGVLDYPIQMLWIMDIPFWLVKKRYYFCPSMSTWNAPSPFFFKDPFLSFGQFPNMCGSYAENLKRTLWGSVGLSVHHLFVGSLNYLVLLRHSLSRRGVWWAPSQFLCPALWPRSTGKKIAAEKIELM